MKRLFLGYHKPKQEDVNKMWKEGIFVFDTSVLLNIYRYTPNTREDFFRILEKLEKNIWLPYQAALEYHEQRENVISQQNNIYEDLESIKDIFNEKILKKYTKGHPFANMQQIERIISKAVDKSKSILKEAQQKTPNLLEEDIYLEKIKDIFNDKVGAAYPKEKLQEIYAEAQKRYKEKIPPGFGDEKNKNGPNVFGDVVLWYQLIDYGIAKNNPIILITDDSKEDWWRKDKKGEILGPHPQLVQEFHEKARTSFYMYLADEFIKIAQQKLDVKIQPGTIIEVREIRQEYERSLNVKNLLMLKKNELELTLQQVRNEIISIKRQEYTLEKELEHSLTSLIRQKSSNGESDLYPESATEEAQRLLEVLRKNIEQNKMHLRELEETHIITLHQLARLENEHHKIYNRSEDSNSSSLTT